MSSKGTKVEEDEVVETKREQPSEATVEGYTSVKHELGFQLLIPTGDRVTSGGAHVTFPGTPITSSDCPCRCGM